MTSVFIVDDSAVVRQVLTDMLENAPGISVIGTAQDPIFAQSRLEKLDTWPDVIILDVEMPRMDGITFLKQLMKEHPTPVVMCSTLTEKGSTTTIKALSIGAVDVIAKPKVNLKVGLAEAARPLIEAIRGAARVNIKRVRTQPVTQPQPTPKLTADAVTSPVSKGGGGVGQIVAIGTSTGGTQALEEVLPLLPVNAPPVLVVQHMPEKFTRAFADRLNGLSTVTVKEAEDGDPVQPGTVLIAPGGRHMLLQNGVNGPTVQVKDGPLVSRHKPSVDVLFRSVAKIAGPDAMGIILTGMGDDGAVGLKEMKDTGAWTLGQDQATSVVYGMPMVAHRKGAVEHQIPLDAVPRCIESYATGRRKLP